MPEQARGENDQLDSLADIWAVGASLFQLLSGQLVYPGENPLQLLVHAATQPARSLDSVTKQLPAAVIALVDRALAFDKAARWASAAAMRTAVRAVRASLVPGAPVANAAAILRGELQLPTAATQAAAPAAQAAPDTSRGARMRGFVGFGLIATLAIGAWLALRAAPAPEAERSRSAAVPTLAPSTTAGRSSVAPISAPPPTAAQPEAASTLVAAPAETTPPSAAVRLPERALEPQARPTPQQPSDTQLAPAPALRHRTPATEGNSAACARLLERQSLGELLSSAEVSQLRDACR